MIPEKINQTVLSESQYFQIDLSPWYGEDNVQSIFNQIESALRNQQMMTITYANQVRTIEPYQLIFKAHDWYLDAYCLKANDWRLFKIVRIDQLTIGDHFIQRPFIPRTLNGSSFIQDDLKQLHLKIHPKAKEKLKAFIHPDQPLKQDCDGWIELTIPFLDDELGYQILLSMGIHVKVLGPKDCVEHFHRYLQSITKHHMN